MSTRPTRRAATMHISYKVDEEDSSEFNEEVSSAEVHDEEESSSGSSAQDFAYSNNADKDGVKENQGSSSESSINQRPLDPPRKCRDDLPQKIPLALPRFRLDLYNVFF